MLRKFILLLVLLCVTCVAYCQSSVFTYQCDFEDADERAMWDRNSGPKGKDCANQWYFGKLGANGGDYGLYVSKDSTSNNYAASALTVVACRTLELQPEHAGEYEFSFDWRAGGWQDSISDEDGLYVFWVPATETIVSVANSSKPKWFDESKALKFDRKSPKLSHSDWNTIVGTLTSDGTPHKLVFAWRNGINGSYPPAVCVDNILIMPEGYCHKPYDLNLEVNDLDATFSWRGESESYDVRC